MTFKFGVTNQLAKYIEQMEENQEEEETISGFLARVFDILFYFVWLYFGIRSDSFFTCPLLQMKESTTTTKSNSLQYIWTNSNNIFCWASRFFRQLMDWLVINFVLSTFAQFLGAIYQYTETLHKQINIIYINICVYTFRNKTKQNKTKQERKKNNKVINFGWFVCLLPHLCQFQSTAINDFPRLFLSTLPSLSTLFFLRLNHSLVYFRFLLFRVSKEWLYIYLNRAFCRLFAPHSLSRRRCTIRAKCGISCLNNKLWLLRAKIPRNSQNTLQLLLDTKMQNYLSIWNYIRTFFSSNQPII